MRRRTSFARLTLLFACSLSAATLRIPHTPGPLVIDGAPDEDAWKAAVVTSLRPAGFGAPFPEGGEARIVVHGKYLYVSARVPEPGRVVARSTGRNPGFWNEDTIAWKFYTYLPGTWRTTIILRVNPFGGFRLDYTSPVGEHPPMGRAVHVVERPEDWRSHDPLVYLVPVKPSRSGEAAMAASRLGAGEWTVEGAIPLSALNDEMGYIEVERVRVRRHDAPELSWHWPVRNVRSEFHIAPHDKTLAAPVSRPAPPGDAPEIGVPRLASLPAIEAGWNDPAWQRAAAIELTRDEANPRTPRFPAEARLAHDGKTLAVFARAVEPETVRASPSSRDGAIGGDDRIEVLLSSGGAYVRVAANVNGAVEDSMGIVPGGRAWPADSWDSHAQAHGTRQAGAWTLRLDIPLARAAAALDAPGIPEQWRILIRRVRPARANSGGEVSTWPVIQSASPFAPARYARLQLLPAGAPAAPRAAKPALQGLAARIAVLSGAVWSNEERTVLRPAQMVEKNLRARMAAVAADERRAWERVRTLDDWKRFREQRLGALKKWMGPFPERTPLNALVTRRADYGQGFAVENLVFESRPHLPVTGNLYLPSRIEGRIPAILLVHCHHAAKTQGELQDMGMNWARAGAAVLVIDLLGAGERVQSNPWRREGYNSRYALHTQLGLAGESLMKWMAWDLMRAIDVLLEKPYIDPTRIAMIGSVAGGGDPAAVTAVLDERVAAVAPFNFGEAGPEEHYIRGPRGYDFETAWPGWGSWELTRNMPRSVADQFFPWFICASLAPRGFIYSFEMGWPNGVERQPPWPRYKKVYELYNRRDWLAEAHGFGPFPSAGERPNVGVEHRHMLYAPLNQWLGVPIPEDEYHDPRPEGEMLCLTPAVAATRVIQPASVLALEIARARLRAARAERAASPRQEAHTRLRAALREKLGDIDPRPQAAARVLWNRDHGAFTTEGIAIESEPDIHLPLVLLKPKHGGERLPAVLALAQGGKERFFSDRAPELARLLESGVAVCLADVRGTGELGSESRAPGAMTLATVELMLGNTMLGAQLKDARTVFAYLARRPDLAAGRVALWGDSFAGVNPRELLIDESAGLQVGPQIQHQAEPAGGLLALLTALYEDSARAVAVRHGVGSFLSALEDRFCYLPLDALVPGLLGVGDVADVVSALNQRALRLEAVVDGRNRLLTADELEPALRAAYSSASGIAAWLVEQSAAQ